MNSSNNLQSVQDEFGNPQENVKRSQAFDGEKHSEYIEAHLQEAFRSKMNIMNGEKVSQQLFIHPLRSESPMSQNSSRDLGQTIKSSDNDPIFKETTNDSRHMISLRDGRSSTFSKSSHDSQNLLAYPEESHYTESETSLLAQKLIIQIRQNGLEFLPLPLYEVILILNNYRLDCQKHHQYAKCEMIDKILKGMRILEEKKHIASLKESQIAERMNLDMQHKVEIDQLEKLWETRFQDFGTYIEELRNSMAERHIKEFEEFKLKFNFELNKIPKFSKKVINLRSIERTLVNQKMFKEAEKVKKKANQIQSNELIEKSHKIAERFEKQKQLLIKRHEMEADALQLKITKIQHDLEIGKRKDLDNARRRYTNAIQNIENNQNILMKKTLRYIKTHEHNTKLAGMAITRLQNEGSTRTSMNPYENEDFGAFEHESIRKQPNKPTNGRHTAIGGTRSLSTTGQDSRTTNNTFVRRSQTPSESIKHRKPFNNSNSHAPTRLNSDLSTSQKSYKGDLPPLTRGSKQLSPLKSKQRRKLQKASNVYSSQSNRSRKEPKDFVF